MIEIVIPQVGEAATEVTLVRWLKSVGDAVEKGEPLFEVDTDKYVIEIEAFASGTLVEIIAADGSGVMPLEAVGRLAPEGVDVHSVPPARPVTDAATAPAPSTDEAARASQDDRRSAADRSVRVLASPKARRIAEELGVELSSLVGHGTGRGGLLTAEDVQQAAEAGDKTEQSGETPELSRARRIIAERTSASKREIPHFYLMADVEMTEVVRLRHYCADDLAWPTAPTITDVILAACAATLRELPNTARAYSPSGLTRRPTIDLGVAVGLDDGLVVPVLRDAGSLELAEITLRSGELVERARSGRLKQADVGDRTIVISNLGMEPVDAFLAIIDPPDPMILSVGRVADRCVAVDGEPVVRPMCTLGLSVDHRALDGVPAARFLGRIATRLESAFELIST